MTGPAAIILAELPWAAGDVPLMALMPALLVLSGFFSGSETALFGMNAADRQKLAQHRGVTGRAVAGLLAGPQMLLITLMLGNMAVNVLYFVIGSALVLKLDPAHDAVWIAVGTLAPLLMIIVFGEVMPKMVANLSPTRWVGAVAVPLWAAHRAIGPLRVVLQRFVIAPLGRLFAPPHRPPALSEAELAGLVDVSEKRGVIDRTEEHLLREVVSLSSLKVRDVMVPRVDVVAWDIEDGGGELRGLIDGKKATKIPAYRGDLDHLEGIVYARQYLLAQRRGASVSAEKLITPVTYVPELQRVDQLLEQFRASGTHLAIAVDEYGGTAGLVTLKDIVERLVGELDFTPEERAESPETPASVEIGAGRWRVSGMLAVHDWGQMFGADRLPERVATVGGLVTALLGRIPSIGDAAALGNLRMEVERMEGGRVESVVLSLEDDAGGEA